LTVIDVGKLTVVAGLICVEFDI